MAGQKNDVDARLEREKGLRQAHAVLSAELDIQKSHADMVQPGKGKCLLCSGKAPDLCLGQFPAERMDKIPQNHGNVLHDDNIRRVLLLTHGLIEDTVLHLEASGKP